MKPNTPVGHHTADEVVELLNLKSKRELFKHLRELGWLIIDKNGVRGGNHNLPRREVIDAGIAYPINCSYGTGPNREISREYRVAVFTPKGFAILKDIFINKKPAPILTKAPAIEPRTTPIAEPPQSNPIKVRQERDRCMERLKNIGIF